MLTILGMAARADASEEALLRAINEGALQIQSKVAVPGPAAGPDSAADLEAVNAAPAASPAPVGGTDILFAITREQERAITDKAFPLMAAKWPFNVIVVCWENFNQSEPAYRDAVKTAVVDTWERHSGLRFIGWLECAPETRGIRIRVEDSGPHVKYIGKYLDGVENGMVLNATYDKWSTVCKSMLDFCNRGIAVHEFGHAIGFAHEQNRPDTPGDCAQRRQGTDGDLLLTPWDPSSVMNYCNPKYNNSGMLSDWDVAAVRYVYGLP